MIPEEIQRHYEVLCRAWAREPTWSNVQDLYRWVKEKSYTDSITENAKEQRNKELAWQLFFNTRVLLDVG